MCGIVGLFLKDPKLEPHLGAMLTDMLITMTAVSYTHLDVYKRQGPGRAHARPVFQIRTQGAVAVGEGGESPGIRHVVPLWT